MNQPTAIRTCRLPFCDVASLLVGLAVGAASIEAQNRELVAPDLTGRLERRTNSELLLRAVPLSTERVRVEFQQAAAVPEARVFDPEGRPVALARTASGTLTADLQTGRTYTQLDPSRPDRVKLGTTMIEFPARYLTPRPATPATPSTPVAAGGFGLWAERSPLVWDETAGAYATTVLVAYQFDDGQEIELVPARTVRFLVEGTGAEVRENLVEVTHSGLRRARQVQLTTREWHAPTVLRAIAGPRDELRIEAGVRREPARFALSLQPEKVPAWGVGAATLSIRLLAHDGEALTLAAEHPLKIQLSSGKLALPDGTVELSPGQDVVPVREVRALGLGQDRIVARAGALEGELPVRITLPLAPLVAALLGGLIGGGLRFLKLKQRRALLERRLIEGALTGLVFTAAVWAGLVATLDTTGVLGTPFGAWVLAALGGYGGSSLLDHLMQRITGQQQPAKL
jgi:hypothetical protein